MVTIHRFRSSLQTLSCHFLLTSFSYDVIKSNVFSISERKATSMDIFTEDLPNGDISVPVSTVSLPDYSSYSGALNPYLPMESKISLPSSQSMQYSIGIHLFDVHHFVSYITCESEIFIACWARTFWTRTVILLLLHFCVTVLCSWDIYFVFFPSNDVLLFVVCCWKPVIFVLNWIMTWYIG